MTIIYVLKDPITREVRYVGKTSWSLNKRLSFHKYHRLKTPIACWIHSLSKSPIIEEIETVENNENWTNVERFWIQWYRANGFRLLNLAEGGEGGTAGIPKSPEWRSKIGLANRGENNGRARLTENDIRAIRHLLDTKRLTQEQIADRYHVSRRTIGLIKNRERWTHVS